MALALHHYHVGFENFKLLFGDDGFDAADKATVMEARLAAPTENRCLEQPAPHIPKSVLI